MTHKSCAVGMRNAKLGNHLKALEWLRRCSARVGSNPILVGTILPFRSIFFRHPVIYHILAASITNQRGLNGGKKSLKPEPMIHFKVAANGIQHFFSFSSLTNQYRNFTVAGNGCKTNFEFASKARITNVSRLLSFTRDFQRELDLIRCATLIKC